jgi:HSP20 family protein
MAAKNITSQERNSKSLSARSKEEYPIVSYLQEMNRMMENFFHGFGLVPHQERPGAFIPNIDMLDAGKEIKITAELPGMEQDDIDISITKEMLTIKGEKKEEKEEKGKGYHRTERSYGAFNRTISLPVEVDTNKIEATFKKGILTIRLPKTEKVLREAKKISIKSG